MIAAIKVAAVIHIIISGVGSFEKRGFTTEAGCRAKNLIPQMWDEEGRPVVVRAECVKR